MSAALLVLGSIACTLVVLLLGALAWLARVEARHEEASGIRTAERPVRAGSSGDLHLFLGFPTGIDEVRALAAEGARERPVEELAPLATRLLAVLPQASRAHLEYGHFRAIKVQPREETTILYLHLRVRSAIPTFTDLGDRAAYAAMLEALAALPPGDVVELSFGEAATSTDPALGRLVRLR